MRYLDIHTHNNSRFSVRNYRINKDSIYRNDFEFSGFYFSAGVHPWDVSLNSLEKTDFSIFENKNLCLIGEIGLDKVNGSDMDLQKLFFYRQLQFADSFKKPVIIHEVKSMQAVLQAKKNFKNIPAWVIHGFRGNGSKARQYLDNGFYLSFGFRFNEDVIKNCPVSRMFLETDDDGRQVEALYGEISRILNADKKKLSENIFSNFTKITSFDNSLEVSL